MAINQKGEEEESEKVRFRLVALVRLSLEILWMEGIEKKY